MNIAILGPGGIADDQHAPAVIAHPDATLWSVLSRSQDRAMEFANRHSLAAPSPAHYRSRLVAEGSRPGCSHHRNARSFARIPSDSGRKGCETCIA